jgi:transcription factor E
MQIKFLKSIVEHLTNSQAVPIVDLLAGKKDVNEFLIAKKLGLTINQTRNILYKLSDFGLVTFTRRKDKRKGWYIYFWTLNIAKSLDLLEQKLKEELNQLELQLKSRMEKRYYVCKTCNVESNEETALLNNFICAECEQVYELANNEEILKKINNEIEGIKKEITLVSEEKRLEGEKLGKKKAIKIKRIEKEKKDKRIKQLKKRKKERDKLKPKGVSKSKNKKTKKTNKS